MSLKTKCLSFALAIAAILMLSFGPIAPAIADEQPPGPIPACCWGQPRFDELDITIIRALETAVDEMKAGRLDYMPGVGVYDMQQELEALGFNLSYCLMAEFGYFYFNCRDYFPAPYAGDRIGDTCQPLNSSDFRTAVSYLFGYDRKSYWSATIYGPTSVPVDTIVPFAQAEWCAANDPVPCGNPKIGGPDNPFMTNPVNALAKLTAGGFTIKDGPDADGNNELYNPDQSIVADDRKAAALFVQDAITVWYSSGAPLLKQYVDGFCTDVNNAFRDNLGVDESGPPGSGTHACGGLNYPLHPVPIDFGTMVNHMLVYHDFDMGRVGWTNLGRFPDWVYDMFHSSFTGEYGTPTWGYNYVGFINDTGRDITPAECPCMGGKPTGLNTNSDNLTRTVFVSLDREQVKCAIYWFQYYFMYDWNPYLTTSTGYAVSAYGRGGGTGGACTRWLEDWCAIPSYCSDNGYTWNQMHWEDNPTGECQNIIRRVSQPPSEFNPWYSDELYEWNFMDRVYEGLIDMHPQYMTDEPFIACDWNVTFWSWPALDIEEGMRCTYWLKNDVYWQDGYKVTAEDVKANWEYLKEYMPGRYRSMWEHLVYCETEGPYKVSAYIDTTSLWLQYSYSGTALFFPKWVLKAVDCACADPADPWDIETPADFRPWEICYCDFVEYVDTYCFPMEPGPWINCTTGIPMCIPGYDPMTGTSEKWDGDCMTMVFGTGAYYFDGYDAGLEKGHMVKNTCYWAGHSELFCNIDAYAGDHETGKEAYEAILWRQDPCTSADFEIQVRNTCGHHVDVNVTASLDGEVFDYAITHIDPWTHVCIHFTSPVVPGCCHYLDQNVTCLDSGCCCCDGFKPVWWTKPEDTGGTLTTEVMTMFSRPRPRYCCGGFTPPFVDGLIPYITADQMQIPTCDVDMRDIAPAAAAYGSYPGHPRWNPCKDLNHDFTVDMRDIARIAANFGWTAPTSCP